MSHTNRKYSLHMLKVGETKLLKTNNPRKARTAVSMFAKRHGWTFTTSQTNKGNVRVWRDA